MEEQVTDQNDAETEAPPLDEPQRDTTQARIAELLRVSEAVRQEGGADLNLPDRVSRHSAFENAPC